MKPCLFPEELTREAYISAASQAAEAHARLSQTHANARRPHRAQAAAQKRPQAAGGHHRQEVVAGFLASADGQQERKMALGAGRRSESFRPSERLRKRSEFVRVQSQGRKVSTPHFLLFVLAGPAEGARLGVTVSRKVGGATERNRIKRLVREVFRRNKPMFPPHRDVVLVAKRMASNLDYAGVLDELRQALRKCSS